MCEGRLKVVASELVSLDTLKLAWVDLDSSQVSVLERSVYDPDFLLCWEMIKFRTKVQKRFLWKFLDNDLKIVQNHTEKPGCTDNKCAEGPMIYMTDYGYMKDRSFFWVFSWNYRIQQLRTIISCAKELYHPKWLDFSSSCCFSLVSISGLLRNPPMSNLYNPNICITVKPLHIKQLVIETNAIVIT